MYKRVFIPDMKEWCVRKPVRYGAVRRGAIVFALVSMLVGLLGSPAHGYSTKPGETYCKGFDLKALTNDAVIENASIKIFDDKGNLLSAKVAASVVVNAELIVCVKVSANAAIDIALEAVLDEDKNGKKDTIVVKVDVLADIDAKVNINAKIKGKIGLTVAVAVEANVDIDVKGGEKKTTKCKGKDGYDQY